MAASRISFVCFCALLWSAGAQPASFNCDKARTQVEKIICGDPQLSALDQKLADSYKTLLDLSTGRDELKTHQQLWLRQRNACQNRECLEDAYLDRLDQLNSALAAAGTEKEHHRYRLVGGGGEPVCTAMLNLYNSQIAKVGTEQYTGQPFSAIRWTRLAVEGDPDAQVADIDLYNNGVKQKVVKIKSSGEGPLTTALFIEYRICKTCAPSSSEVAKADLYRSTVSLRPQSYWFRYGNKSDALDDPEIAVPFVFNGVTYVSLRNLDRSSLRTGDVMPSNGFHLVVKYSPDIEAYEDALKAKVRAALSARHNLGLEDRLVLQGKFFSIACIFAR